MKESGLEEYMGRIFNKLFLKCLDFTLERILFHLFDDLEITRKRKKKKRIFLHHSFYREKEKKRTLTDVSHSVQHRRVSFLLSVLSFPNG